MKSFPLSRQHFLKLGLGMSAALFLPFSRQANSIAADPSSSELLPSWQSGETKNRLVSFVQQVTQPHSPKFIPVADRIAVFDNDGTLWCEQPFIQLLFLEQQLQTAIIADPSLKQDPIIQALLAGDLATVKEGGAPALMKVMAVTVANQTETEYRQTVQKFFETTQYPGLNVPLAQVVYQPMLELLDYLRAHQFQTWICSGGGVDFIRVISQSFYGITPQQVIGSRLKKEYCSVQGKKQIWRLPEIAHINDKAGKPVGIDQQIGKIPVITVGNVRSGGDIAMLNYSQSSQSMFEKF